MVEFVRIVGRFDLHLHFSAGQFTCIVGRMLAIRLLLIVLSVVLLPSWPGQLPDLKSHKNRERTLNCASD